MSTYKGHDDCTDLILDMLSEHESAGNYNAVIGDAQATDDLAQYSIDDIYGLMADLLDERQPSTAVGRYQIIRATLRALQSVHGIAGSEKFTPELQDKLAVWLMVGRGYTRWWTGQMTDAAFAHGLSMEWASLPDPLNGGRSHYDHVGPNHAGTTLAHVYDALRRAKLVKPK